MVCFKGLVSYRRIYCASSFFWSGPLLSAAWWLLGAHYEVLLKSLISDIHHLLTNTFTGLLHADLTSVFAPILNVDVYCKDPSAWETISLHTPSSSKIPAF
jgi:hypothetical protein